MATIKEVDLQLSIGGAWKSADVDTSAFSFNMQMTDITQPSAVLMPYSAQIKLPLTKNNNDIFNHICRLDHSVSGFNPLTRTAFKLYVAASLYQEGYMKMESISGNGYSIRLYGGIGDLFYMLSEVSETRDMRLKNLPFGNFFDHVINASFISNCWISGNISQLPYHDYASGLDVTEEVLTYAMTYQGQYDNFDSDSVLDSNQETQEAYWVNLAGTQKYVSPVLDEHKRNSILPNGLTRAGEFRSYYQRPAIRLKMLYNKIIEQAVNAGWKINLDPTFFNPDNPYWNDLYIIFPQYKFEGEISNNNVTVGVKNENWYSSAISQQSGDAVISIDTNYANRIQGGKNYNISIKVSFNVAALRSNMLFSRDVIKRNSVSITPVTVINNVEYPLGSPLTLSESNLEKRAIDAFNDGYLQYPGYDGGVNFLYSTYGNQYSHKGNTWDFNGNINFDATGLTGDIPFEIRFKISGDTWYQTQLGNGYFDIPMSLGIIINPNSRAYIKPIPDDSLRSGSRITYTDIVNSDETCFDLLINYGKIFGLYYDKDDTSKTVDIVTRKTFFAGREKTDWTEKIDYSKGTELQPVPFTYKTGVFKWKNAGTKYEDQYLKSTDKEYGSLTFDTGYEFSNEKKDYLESMFANCIVASDYSQYYAGRSDTVFKDNKTLPYLMDKDGKGTEQGMVLLFKNGLSSSQNFFFISDDSINMTEGFCWIDVTGFTQTSYPKFTRIFGNANGVYSLNFGRPGVAYNSDEATLINPDSTNGDETIYSRFWKAYINDIFNQNNKVLTCYVMLSLSDIYSNMFKKFIYINNTVWVLDKIHNFNPVGMGPTKVTLVKVQDVENYANGQNY